MAYRVNEIFYSIQAEGHWAGRPAVFVRFSGCNLNCSFCDTNHEPYMEMTKAQIEKTVDELDPSGRAMVVFTGGEPTLQLKNEEPLLEGRYRAIETNGILEAPNWVDWTTVSPKTKPENSNDWFRMSELKVLYGQFDNAYLVELGEKAKREGVELYIQPMANKDDTFDILPALEFAKGHPDWRLSIQYHKIFKIR